MVDLLDGVKWYLVFLFSTCCHEAAHAWTAQNLHHLILRHANSDLLPRFGGDPVAWPQQ